MEWYVALRAVHRVCAVLSLLGFFVRGGALVLGAGWPRWPWVRRVVDGNDALLLGAAIGMVVLSGQYPFAVPWLTAKVLGLFVYIGLGVVAFRFAKTSVQRLVAWLSALTVGAYIVSVALTKSPLGFLSGFI